MSRDPMTQSAQTLWSGRTVLLPPLIATLVVGLVSEVAIRVQPAFTGARADTESPIDSFGTRAILFLLFGGGAFMVGSVIAYALLRIDALGRSPRFWRVVGGWCLIGTSMGVVAAILMPGLGREVLLRASLALVVVVWALAAGLVQALVLRGAGSIQDR